MSASHGFKQVFMAGAVGAAALGCYLVSLSVASTRAELEATETKILLAQRDIRTLETEVGTRGRLAQLERWNTRFIRLSAPQADQFVEGAFQLATLTKPADKSPIDAPVVLASAPAPEPKAPVLGGDADIDDSGAAVSATRPSLRPDAMMHVASLKVEPVRSQPRAVTLNVAPPKARAASTTIKAPPTRPAAAKPVKTASADPLAPLPNASAKAKATAAKSKE